MLTFIDESGYPRPTDSTKNPILLGVCIHENDIKPITNQIYKLKDSIYGKQDEIKSTKLIREATITKNRTNNKAYVEGMVDIITSYDAAIFAVIMDKPDEPIIVPEHHLPKQYYLLLKKVEFYCNHHHYGKAMMIFDEVHEDADRKIAEAITGFLFKTKFGKIVETFVPRLPELLRNRVSIRTGIHFLLPVLFLLPFFHLCFPVRTAFPSQSSF